MRGLGRLKQIGNRVRNRISPGALILLYHRVGNLPTDPQLLSVTPQHFEEQLQVIKQLGVPTKLKDLADGIRQRKVVSKSIVVTFDDGAGDNLWQAKPLLEKHEVPATVFVSTGYVKSGREYWWDELDRLLLQPGTLPVELHLQNGAKSFDWSLADSNIYAETEWQRFQSWNVSSGELPTDRHKLYRALIDFLLPLSASERFHLLDEIKVWTGKESATRTSHRALTEAEVRELAEDGLVEVGAHTVTHSVLAALPVAQQQQEIQDSKRDLEEIVGRAVTSFAYPFGTLQDYTPETVKIVKQSGFDYACSNYKDVVHPNADVFQLPRVIVRDWSGAEFAERLESWFRG